MSNDNYPTGLGMSTESTISLMGVDLAQDILGKVGFGELSLWMIRQQRPRAGEVRLFEAVLCALADHGFTPTAIAARVTFLSAPDSVQGAIASGLLGGGSRFLGVTEDAGNFLSNVLAELPTPFPTASAEWDSIARDVITRTRREKSFIPGLGHPVHKVSDPRTKALITLAHQEGVFGPHLALFEAIGRSHEDILGRKLPLNGAGVCGAVLCDLDIPREILRGVALLARTAGLVAQLAEEVRNPVARDIYLQVENNAVFEPSPYQPREKD